MVADMDGAFPEGFYSTTNQRTEVRLSGHWHEVDLQEMDCGIVVSADHKQVKCLPMVDVRRGDLIIVGHAGVRVFPPQRAVQHHLFEFMGSNVSTEKPKTVAIRAIAASWRTIAPQGVAHCWSEGRLSSTPTVAGTSAR